MLKYDVYKRAFTRIRLCNTCATVVFHNAENSQQKSPANSGSRGKPAPTSDTKKPLAAVNKSVAVSEVGKKTSSPGNNKPASFLEMKRPAAASAASKPGSGFFYG